MIRKTQDWEHSHSESKAFRTHRHSPLLRPRPQPSRCQLPRSPSPRPQDPHAIALFFALALSRLDANFLVVLLQGRKILTRLGELTFLHTFADVPMHKRALGVHQVELMIDTR